MVRFGNAWRTVVMVCTVTGDPPALPPRGATLEEPRVARVLEGLLGSEAAALWVGAALARSP
jgi:hypothetical protein